MIIYINNTPVDLDKYPDIAEMGPLEALEEIFVRGIVGEGMSREEFWECFDAQRPEFNLVSVNADDDAGKEYQRQLHQQELKISLKNKHGMETSEDLTVLGEMWKRFTTWVKLVS